MKRILTHAFFVFSLLLMLFVSVINASAASTATASVTLSSTNVYTGDTVTATVTYSSTSAIGGWNFYLNYDASMLEYVSGADSQSAGSCRFANVNMDASNAKTTVSFTVTFKAIATGTATVSTKTQEIVGEDYSNAAVTEGSKKVAISNKPVYVPSSVNTLKSLSVVGFAMEPAFSKDVTEYSLTIEYPTTSVEIAAVTESNLATYSVYGANRMDIGDNIVIVTVVAENGDKKQYNIHIKRNESPYKAVTVKPDGINEMTFPVEVGDLEIPDGFRADVSKCQGEDVLSFVNSTGAIRLAALNGISAEGEKQTKWFLYDADENSFSPYVDYAPGNMRYVFLTPPDNLEAPEGYYKESLTIGGANLPAFQNSKFDERYYLVYATPVSGSPALYTYDSLENTMQLYMTYDGIPTESQISDLQNQLDAESAAHNSDKEAAEKERSALSQQISESEQKDKILLIAAGSFAVLFLLFFILFLIAKSKAKKVQESPDESIRDTDDIPNFEDSSEPDALVFDKDSFSTDSNIPEIDAVPTQTEISPVSPAPSPNVGESNPSSDIEYSAVFFPDVNESKDEDLASVEEFTSPLPPNAADLLSGSMTSQDLAQIMSEAENGETVRYEPATGTFTRIPGVRKVPTADEVRHPNEVRSAKAPAIEKAPHSIGSKHPAPPKKKKRSVKSNRAHF